MPGQLRTERPRRAPEPVLVGLLFVVAGIVAGALWAWWWPAPVGVVGGGELLLDGEGMRVQFTATALYVLGAAGLGLVLGVLTTLLFERDEVATLVGVALGSALAGLLMLLVGQALGPADADVLARTAADQTELALDLSAPAVALIAAPTGALTGALVVFLGITRRETRRPRQPSDA